MALIQCPECGHQVSDSAKKCPNCGIKLKRSNSNFSINLVINILFVVAAITALLPLYLLLNAYSFRFYGFIQYNGIVVQNCIGALSGFVVLLLIAFWLRKKYMQRKLKLFWIIASSVLIFYTGFIIIFGDTSKRWDLIGEERNSKLQQETNKQEEVNNTENVTASNKNTSSNASFIGTWNYSQPNNPRGDVSLTLIINDDETVRAIKKSKEGEKIFYGSWKDIGGYGDKPNIISMSFEDTNVYVPGFGYNAGGYVCDLVAWINFGSGLELTYATLQEGYLYDGTRSAKAKKSGETC